MPTLDDIPTLAIGNPYTGDDLIPVYDLTSTGSSKVRKVPFNTILGLDPSDSISTTSGTTFTVVNRLTVLTGGTICTLTFPAATGSLRELIVINSNSGNAAAPALAAGSIIIATGVSARFLSNGTAWYRVS